MRPWFETHLARLRPGRRRPTTGRLSPRAEALERRIVLTGSTWTGLGDGSSWSDRANWDVAPKDGYDLIFPAGIADQFVVDDVASLRANSLTFQGGYAVSDSGSSSLILGPGGITLANAGEAVSLVVTDLTIGADASLTIPSGTSLDFLQNTSTLDGAGALTKRGGGILTFNPQGTANYKGKIRIGGGGITIGTSTTIKSSMSLDPATTLTVSGGNSFDIGDLTGGTVEVDAGAALRFTTAVAFNYSGNLTGLGSLIKLGAGVLTLSGQNTYTGATDVEGGTLALAQGSSVGRGSGLIVAQGAALYLNGNNTRIAEYQGNNILNNSGLQPPLAGKGRIDLGGATLTMTIDPSDGEVDGDFGGAITGSGSLVQDGGGTLAFSNPIAYSGPYDLKSGTLELGNSQSVVPFVMASDLTVEGTSTLSIGSSSVVPATLGSIAGSGTVYLGQNLTVGDASSTSFTGTLSGASNLIEKGTGTFSLSPTSIGAFSGVVSAQGGVLRPGGANNLASYRLDLNGGTLGGTSAIESAPTIESGRIAPGTSTPGSLLLPGGTALNARTTLAIRLNGKPGTGGSDELTTYGGATLDLGGSTLSVSTGYASQAGDGFVIVASANMDRFGFGLARFTGQFANLPDGSTVNAGGVPFAIRYLTTTNFNGLVLPFPVVFEVVLTRVAAGTTTTVSALPGTAIPGQSVTLSAAVAEATPFTGIPAGTVTFFDGTRSLGTATLDASGVARLSIASLGLGSHPVTATYQGTTNDLTSASAATNVAIRYDPSAVSLSTSATSAVAGQAVTLTSTVGSASGRTAAGLVTFFEGPIAIGSAMLSGGVAHFTTSSLATGTHGIFASYASDGVSAPGTSSVVSILIKPEATATTLSASPTSLTLQQPVTLTLTVGPVAPGTATPSGSVQWLDGTKVLGTAQLDVTGRASLHYSGLGLGTHSISANYLGTAGIAPSNSRPVSLYVGDGNRQDFDGDGKGDIAVYGNDPRTGKYDFRVLSSSTNFDPARAVAFDNFGYGFGNSRSIPVPADYFGDGKSAYALWTPNALGGLTFTAVSSVSYKAISVDFGGTRDIPVIADVDGDGRADFGVYGYQAGLGYRFDFLLSSRSFSANQQSVFNNDGYGYGNARAIPVVADFDGSGKAGFGLYIPSASGSFFTYIAPSANVSFTRIIGGPGDIPTAVDYDGDGKADLALYGPDPGKPGHYRYEVLTSTSSFDAARPVAFDNYGSGYGNASTVPVIADYEGTGKADFALYLPDSRGGMQFIYQTSQVGAGVSVDFAAATDIPLTEPTYLIARKIRGY